MATCRSEDKEPRDNKLNSIPYTGKLTALAKHQVIAIIDKVLKDDARSNMSAIAA